MKYILAAVFLISTALAYPLADQEEIKPDVPLVITDYSSIAKSEPTVEIAKVQQDEIKDISHESHSTNQQDSSESNESASVESGEKVQENQPSLEELAPQKSEEVEKPLLDEIVSQEQPQVSAEPIPEKPLVLAEQVQQTLDESKLEEPKPEDLPQLKSIEENIALVIPEEKPVETVVAEKLPELNVVSNEAIPEPKVGLSEIDKVIPQESAPIPVSNPIPAEIQEQLLTQEITLVEEAPLIVPVAKIEEPLVDNKLEEEKPLENQVEQKSLPEDPKVENSLVSDEKLPEPAPVELLPIPVEEIKAALPEEIKPDLVLESKTAPLEIVESQVVPIAPVEENLPAKTLPEENLQVTLPAEPEKLADLPASEELPALKKEEELPAPEKAAELPLPEIKIDAPLETPVAIELPVQTSEESLKQSPQSEEVSASVEKLPEPSPSS